MVKVAKTFLQAETSNYQNISPKASFELQKKTVHKNKSDMLVNACSSEMKLRDTEIYSLSN